MRTQHVLMKQEAPGILTIILNRPEKRNAMNIPFLEDLCRSIGIANKKKDIRIFVLQGNGTIFSSGIDLNEATDPYITHHSATLLAQALRGIYLSPKITIAAVQGAAIASGAGLMSACDYVLAEEDTYFKFPETRLGLVPSLAMTLLRRILNERQIRELILLGESINAKKAKALGLINKIVPNGSLADETTKITKTMLKGAPQATVHAKELLDELYPSSFSQDLEHALRHHIEARRSEEGEEGVTAFLEKRTPSWEPKE